MKTGKLILALVFLMLFADASMAAKWKAKHVVLIGLDVEKTLCTSVFQCRKLGFHVYGGGTGTSWLHGMGIANSGTAFPCSE